MNLAYSPFGDVDTAKATMPEAGCRVAHLVPVTDQTYIERIQALGAWLSICNPLHRSGALGAPQVLTSTLISERNGNRNEVPTDITGTGLFAGETEANPSPSTEIGATRDACDGDQGTHQLNPRITALGHRRIAPPET